MIKQTDRIYAYRVMQLLLKPFTETKAYDLGIIDAKGKELRPATDKEQGSYSRLHKMAFQVKQIIDDLPSGKQRLRKIATAMGLLRPTGVPKMYQEDVENSYLKFLDVIMEMDIGQPEEESMIALAEGSNLVFVSDFLTEGNLFTIQLESQEFTIGAANIEEAKSIAKKCLGISEDMITTAAIDASTPRIKGKKDVCATDK